MTRLRLGKSIDMAVTFLNVYWHHRVTKSTARKSQQTLGNDDDGNGDIREFPQPSQSIFAPKALSWILSSGI
jgi:hypothetical protein